MTQIEAGASKASLSPCSTSASSLGTLQDLQDLCKSLSTSSSARRQFVHSCLVRPQRVHHDLIAPLLGTVDRYFEAEEVQEQEANRALYAARILRNAAADEEQGQLLIFSALLENNVQLALWRLTSFASTQNSSAVLLCQALTQALANCITNHPANAARFWTLLEPALLPSSEHSRDTSLNLVHLLVRLLDSQSKGTRAAVEVMLDNLLLSDPSRSNALALTSEGRALLGAVLRNAADDLQIDEQEGSQVPNLPDTIAVAYEMFSIIFSRHLCGRLLEGLGGSGTADISSDESVPVTTRQIALLQMFDAYLVHGASNRSLSSRPSVTQTHDSMLVDDLQSGQTDLLHLVNTFVGLAAYTSKLMSRLSKCDETASDAARMIDQGHLVQAHTALVLLLQCLSSIGLAGAHASSTHATKVSPDSRSRHESGEVLDALSEEGNVRTVITLLQSTSAFSPAVSPFANLATGGAASAAVAAPEGHVLTSTGQAGLTAGAGAGASASVGGVGGLQNLKRDLVRLIGVMSFFDPASGGGLAHTQSQVQAQTDRNHRSARVRAVQDVVRESGGLLEVLNMTQLDENNPYIREHAIFALRNLLQGNAASQELIKQLRPLSPSR